MCPWVIWTTTTAKQAIELTNSRIATSWSWKIWCKRWILMEGPSTKCNLENSLRKSSLFIWSCAIWLRESKYSPPYSKLRDLFLSNNIFRKSRKGSSWGKQINFWSWNRILIVIRRKRTVRASSLAGPPAKDPEYHPDRDLWSRKIKYLSKS